jgi:hypothetical protein
MQHPAYLELLKKRFRFEEWSDASAGSAATQSVIFSGNEFSGWSVVRQVRRESPGHPPFVRSMWQGASPEQLLGIDIFECASPAAAREYLLQRLGEFQGPTLTRDAALRIGEVAFATPEESVIAFVRGSAVAVVHNAGRRIEPLGGVARALDTLLGAKGGRKSR